MTQHHKHAILEQAGPGKPTIPTKVAMPSGDNDHRKSVSDEDIRLCAYQKWEAAGKPAGDGVRFWLEAEQELMHGKNEEFVQERGWHGYHEHEWQEAEKVVKESNVNVDSHYRDNNRMFQSHGQRGHRHGGSS